METAAINRSSLAIQYKQWSGNIPCIKNNRLLLPSNSMWWKIRINSLTESLLTSLCSLDAKLTWNVCDRSFVPLYEIIVWSFCKVLKYLVLEGKLCPPRCDRYVLNIHYCCPFNWGRVCDKGLCFKTEPSAERPGQPVKISLNTAAYTGTTWNGM